MTTRSTFSRAKELYNAALSRPPTERETFLAEACGGDEEPEDSARAGFGDVLKPSS